VYIRVYEADKVDKGISIFFGALCARIVKHNFPLKKLKLTSYAQVQLMAVLATSTL